MSEREALRELIALNPLLEGSGLILAQHPGVDRTIYRFEHLLADFVY